MLSKDIREMSEADIRTRIAELDEERFRLKFRQGTETLDDPLRLRVIRKDIARLNTVLSDKMDKTVVVSIERRVQHPVYGKMVRRTKRLKAHDERNDAKTGDTVRIMETRPLSKDKRWRLVEIVERAR